jgi:micrococcal nuclease
MIFTTLIASSALAIATVAPETVTRVIALKKPPETVSCKITATEKPTWIEIARVKDGDTFEGTCKDRFGFPEIFRLRDLDTPEKGALAKCPEEDFHAKAATEFARNLGLSGKNKVLATVAKRKEKYGRYLSDATFYATEGEIDWREAMIKAGYALPYDGGKKADWCALLKFKL